MFEPEYCKSSDKLMNYCYNEYIPATPIEGKLSSVNLLFNSFEQSPEKDKFVKLVNDIRSSIGSGRTVWGLKMTGSTLSWEFYFYNYFQPDLNMSDVLKSMSGIVRCDFELPSNKNIVIYSFDIDERAVHSGMIERAHVYTDTASGVTDSPDGLIRTVMTYILTKNDVTKGNFYCVYSDHARQMKSIVRNSTHSVFCSPNNVRHADIIWPELIKCRNITLANKPRADGIYFSGLSVDQFIFSLKKLGYPDNIVSFVESNRNKLDHMKYDVGFDYRSENGNLKIVRSGFFGLF
jgi:hypothetical protein